MLELHDRQTAAVEAVAAAKMESSRGRHDCVRRLDHIAIAVRDTEAALTHFVAGYGLEVLASEVIERPHVRLTYLDCGNA